MASLSIQWERSREDLAQAIVAVIRKWPERDRCVFVGARYRGQNIEEISHSSGLKVGEVRRVLAGCERRLHEALRKFRHEASAPAD
ncbi:MAG: hypothetical protein ABIG68_14090, partial [Acidobacteriota bacterium]